MFHMCTTKTKLCVSQRERMSVETFYKRTSGFSSLMCICICSLSQCLVEPPVISAVIIAIRAASLCGQDTMWLLDTSLINALLAQPASLGLS